MSAPSSSSSNDNNRDCPKVQLIWHRRDLRLNDNEVYSDSNNVQHINGEELTDKTTTCTSLFIFDTHYVTPQSSCVAGADYNVLLHGPHFLQAQLEAVTALRRSLHQIGGELIVRMGDPIKLIPEIARLVNATACVCGGPRNI